jgi:hypothetical protein
LKIPIQPFTVQHTIVASRANAHNAMMRLFVSVGLCHLGIRTVRALFSRSVVPISSFNREEGSLSKRQLLLGRQHTFTKQ